MLLIYVAQTLQLLGGVRQMPVQSTQLPRRPAAVVQGLAVGVEQPVLLSPLPMKLLRYNM